MTLIDFQMILKLKLLKRRTVHILEIQFYLLPCWFFRKSFCSSNKEVSSNHSWNLNDKMILCNFFILFDLCFSFCSPWDFVWARKLEIICDFPFDNDSLFFFRYYAVGETMVSTKEELAIAQESLIEVVGAFFFWVSEAKQDGMGVGFLHSVISQETLHHLLTSRCKSKTDQDLVTSFFLYFRRLICF